MKKISKYTYIIILTLPILLYVSFFRNHNFSNESADWSNFATYFSAFISLANLIVFITLSKQLYEYNRKKDIQDDIYKTHTERPILSFIKKTDENCYTVSNIGNGVALNIIIKGNLYNSKWNDAYLYYSISKDQMISLYWAQSINCLAAEYEDIFGRKYYSFMDDDTLRFFNESKDDYPTERKKISYPLNGSLKRP